MPKKDTTQSFVISCHSLDHDNASRSIRANSWKDALQALWPHPYCMIMRRTKGDRAFLAVRLEGDGKTVTYRTGRTPEEAREAARQEWRAHLEQHPEEMVRRNLEPARRLLEGRGFSPEDCWEEMILDVGRCRTYLEARRVLGESLDRVAPFLGERDRLKVVLLLERVPFSLTHQASKPENQELPRQGESSKGMASRPAERKPHCNTRYPHWIEPRSPHWFGSLRHIAKSA